MNISKIQYQKYLAMGWSVIPWRLVDDGDGKVSKPPAIATWREFQKRRATEEEVEQWADKYNAIAVVTGKISDLTIVDVDTHNEAALSFKKLDAAIIVSSAFSGGKHYYYKFTPDGRTTTKLDNAPVDMRSEGGIIILPPSNLNGREYVFDKLEPTWSLTQVPKDVIKAIETKRAETAIPVGDEFPDAGEGNRNEIATRILGSLFSRVEYGLGEEAIWPSILYWNQTKTGGNPLPQDELRRTYESIRDAHARNHPELILGPNDFGLPKDLNTVANDRMAEQLLEDQAPSTGYPGLDNLVRGFIPGHTYTMTGQTNVGKTATCCNFAINVADSGKRVLYFALEPGNTIVDYLASVKYRQTFAATRDKLVNLGKNIDVFTEGVRSIDQLKLIIRKLERYDLVIIDHISYFIGGGENYIQEQASAMKELNLIAKEKKSAILLVAHINKSASLGKSVITYDSISGSSAFKQDSTEVLILTKELDNSGKIIVAKTKCGPNGTVDIQFMPGSAYIYDQGNISFGAPHVKPS